MTSPRMAPGLARLVILVGSAVALAGGAAGAGAAVAAPTAGSWGQAIEVPGLAALNAGGSASVTSVSCASPGNCAAVGSYQDSSGHTQGFVASERSGGWRFAFEVPGLGALNSGGQAGVSSVSCPAVGDCVAGGYYRISGGDFRWFVVNEDKGVWAKAITVPGLASLNSGVSDESLSVSCASAGNCAAGGSYRDRHGISQGFVVSERKGVWQKAVSVPGLGDLNKTGGADVVSVSCPSAGNCAAGGTYGGYDPNVGNTKEGFVVSERNGAWSRAIEIPGLGALNQAEIVTPVASVLSLSCSSAGNCAAVGYYTSGDIPDGPGVPTYSGFVASERNGRWGKAIQDPGLRGLNSGQVAQTFSVSCPSVGNCSAGGYYLTASQDYQGFVASEQKGVWAKAIGVPGLASLNAGGFGQIFSVSCPSSGNCGAGGQYQDTKGDNQAFVADESGGTWAQAIEVPGLAVLNAGGNAEATEVSCTSGGFCAAGGFYKDSSGHTQGFVVSRG
jgi:hypothetical protein